MRCKWCDKVTDNLLDYTDAIGESHKICKTCKTSVDNCECRKCGTVTDPSMMIDGLCTNCIQVKLREKSKKQEEARLGVSSELMENLTSDLEFTDDDYERWLLFGNAFSPKDMKKSKELKRLWIMVKLNGAGIFDTNLLKQYFPDVETLLDRNFSKLVNNRCRILIGNTPQARKVVRTSEVIDYENEVYILKGMNKTSEEESKAQN